MLTSFEEVFNSFKNKIIDYDFLDFTEEEEYILLNESLKSALVKFKAKRRNIKADYDLRVFNRELEQEEVESLSYWLVYEWCLKKVNDVEIMRYSLSTSQFKGFSKKHHLDGLINNKNNAEYDAMYYMNNMDSENLKIELSKKYEL